MQDKAQQKAQLRAQINCGAQIRPCSHHADLTMAVKEFVGLVIYIVEMQ